jgi:uncharacterized membrane protein
VIIAVVLVVILTLAVACAVAWPLLRGGDRGAAAAPGDGLPDEREERRRDLREALDRSLAAIREIEFDHRSGHLSDEDFAALDAAERARAVALIRELDELGGR